MMQIGTHKKTKLLMSWVTAHTVSLVTMGMATATMVMAILATTMMSTCLVLMGMASQGMTPSIIMGATRSHTVPMIITHHTMDTMSIPVPLVGSVAALLVQVSAPGALQAPRPMLPASLAPQDPQPAQAGPARVTYVRLAMQALTAPSALQASGLQEDLLPPPPARAAPQASQAQLDLPLQ